MTTQLQLYVPGKISWNYFTLSSLSLNCFWTTINCTLLLLIITLYLFIFLFSFLYFIGRNMPHLHDCGFYLRFWIITYFKSSIWLGFFTSSWLSKIKHLLFSIFFFSYKYKFKAFCILSFRFPNILIYFKYSL